MFRDSYAKGFEGRTRRSDFKLRKLFSMALMNVLISSLEKLAFLHRREKFLMLLGSFGMIMLNPSRDDIYWRVMASFKRLRGNLEIFAVKKRSCLSDIMIFFAFSLKVYSRGGRVSNFLESSSRFEQPLRVSFNSRSLGFKRGRFIMRNREIPSSLS